MNNDALSIMSDEEAYHNDGIDALVLAARQFHLRVEAGHLRHQSGVHDGVLQPWQLCRCAIQAGLRARHTDVPLQRLAFQSAPALVRLKGYGWLVLVSVSQEKVILAEGHSGLTTEYSLIQLEDIWLNDMILLAEPRKITKRRAFGFGWFFPSLRRHQVLFSHVIIASLVLQGIALVSPVLFEKVTDKVLISRSLSSLDVLGIAMLGLAVFEPLWGYVRAVLFSGLAGKVNAELSGRLFRHLFALPVRYFQQRQTGEIIARVREMQHIRQFLTGSSLSMVLDLLFVGVFIAVMFFYSALLTGIVLASLVLYFLFWLCVGPALRQSILHQYEMATDNTAFLTESVNGIETIKTSASGEIFTRRQEKMLAGYIRQSLKVRIQGILAGQGITLIQKLTSALVLWWGVSLVMEGNLTPGELIAFNMFSGHVTQPILRLAQAWQDFQHTLISLRRIGDILDSEEESGQGGLASVPQLQGGIRFHHVHFRYTEETPEVIRGLNLDIRPGEFIGITGASGSGKSTLTRLLQRFYVPQHGQILVDGMDLAIADPVSLRRHMSVVLQDSVLFSGSVADNIRQCSPRATDDELFRAARLAGAHEFILGLPDGYQTQVGEKGGLLSGGQRQRIALARALITSPRILILDEATSALDYESEAEIMRNMKEICRGRTVISIAHRLSTIKDADRILVMDKGHIAEEGTHADLVELNGLYSNLWGGQSL
ncbi:type I secretion system permease/ATPase [Enterobacter roggenkampii]|nr:type I secretion system permease/ATPase [Enterobacter roggenkampii]MEB5887483.1 type I secretion system permease/ATPase [Enterobacter roggenkampii]